MNALEHQLDYPFADTLPAAGDTFEVAPGVRWLRMPLPFSLDHINLWLLRDEIDGQAGWTVVDCGISSDAIRTHWEAIFDRHLDGLPVLRVLVTHCHPDHFGLANWICEGGDQGRWNARLWMTLGEYMFGCLMAAGNGSNAGGAAAADHFARHGLTDPVALDKLRSRRSYYSDLVPAVPPRYRRLREGDAVNNLICSEASLAVSRMPKGAEFQKRFEARFNGPILFNAPFAYDAVYVIADAMRRANTTDAAKVLAALPATDYNGVIGRIAFDAHGDMKEGAITLYHYQDKKKTLLDVVKYGGAST